MGNGVIPQRAVGIDELRAMRAQQIQQQAGNFASVHLQIFGNILTPKDRDDLTQLKRKLDLAGKVTEYFLESVQARMMNEAREAGFLPDEPPSKIVQ